jgi:putative ABC transport system ATP-binding protein
MIMSELVIAENVSRIFKMKNRQVKAVDNVSLVIKEGTFNILCGRSGSGKTTLLNILAAIDTPSEGKVSFGGKDITAVREKHRDNIRRKNMGIVFQNTALMSNMSAVENVEFALSLAGVKASKRRKLAISWLEKMGIRERRNHMPAEMSGGEQARVAIGRALAHSPKLLLADEPTSELDSATSFAVVKLLRELVDNEGLTVIMATHDVNIMDIADNVYTMEDGRITDVREVKESC